MPLLIGIARHWRRSEQRAANGRDQDARNDTNDAVERLACLFVMVHLQVAVSALLAFAGVLHRRVLGVHGHDAPGEPARIANGLTSQGVVTHVPNEPADVIGMNGAKEVAQRGVGREPGDANEAADSLWHPLGQILECGQALAAGRQSDADDPEQGRRALPASALPVAWVADEAEQRVGEEPADEACCSTQHSGISHQSSYCGRRSSNGARICC